MPIADFSGWLSALKNRPTYTNSVASLNGNSGGITAGRFFSFYQLQVPTLTAPTSAVNLDRTTTGTFGQINTTSGDNFLIGMESRYQFPITLLLVDRLSHQGGLSSNSTSIQTTNLPTAALTRYTSGEGVMAGIEVYGQLSSTAGAVSVSYTNSGATSGRTSPTIAIPASTQAGSFYCVPLQSGDTGIKSVESLTFSTAMGTGSTVGITLFKPLAMLQVIPNEETRGNFVDGNLIGGIPNIPNDAALFLLAFYHNLSTSVSNAVNTTIQLTES